MMFRKYIARFLVAAGLTTVLSAGINGVAPGWAARQSHCPVYQVQMIPIELARSGEEVRNLINGQPAQAPAPQVPVPLSVNRDEQCYREQLRAALSADTFFLSSYSALNLAIFLFVIALGRVRSKPVWTILGLVLTAAMLFGDIAENHYLGKLVELVAGSSPIGELQKWLPELRIATNTKWISLAITSACLGLLYRRRTTLRIVFGLATAALFGAGLGFHQPRLVAWGMLPLALLWLAFLVEAVAVLRDRDPFSSPVRASDPRDGGTSPFRRAYPEELDRRECALVEERRRKAKLPPDTRKVGCGLSGGGIRSATFCLGVFQGMAAKPGLLKQIDFLSTVSGGGYFGGFFGRLLARDYVTSPEDIEDTLLGKKNPKAVEFLRQNGRYLAPNGAGDTLLAGAEILRNWVSIHIVLAIFVLMAFLACQALRIGAFKIPGVETWLGWTLRGPLWWSPWLLLPVASFVLAAFPIGWAYWLVKPESEAIRRGAGDSRDRSEWVIRWSGLALTAALSLWLSSLPFPGNRFFILVAVVCLATFLWWFAVITLAEPDTLPATTPETEEEQKDRELYSNRRIPNRLGLWLSWALTVTAILLILGLIDSLGQSLYLALRDKPLRLQWVAGLASLGALISGFAKRIVAFTSKGPKNDRPSLPLQWIASAAALIVVTLLLVNLNALSHAITWQFEKPQFAIDAVFKPPKDARTVSLQLRNNGLPLPPLRVSRETRAPAATGSPDKRPTPPVLTAEGDRKERLRAALIGLGATILLSLLFGRTWSFVNRSSHHAMYSGRLTRAYLGASNPERWNGRSLTEAQPHDDYDLARYWPPPTDKAAPIHLINMTVNETIDNRSQVQQRDRKGLGMAIGPFGLSVGVQHHIVMPLGRDDNMNPEGLSGKIYPETGHRVFAYPDGKFAGEMLPLGSWIGISGAAFSTGTGMRTSLGLSLLAGLGNVRLGRWWNSGVDRSEDGKRKIGLRLEDWLARLFPVQGYLLNEFLARFPGTQRRHWYLSDGGHFENMGGYELIRRRLPFIIIVDAEQDEDFGFEGLANLVRKARLDFGAEIHFYDEDELDDKLETSVRRAFGPLKHLRRGKWEAGPEVHRARLVEADLKGFSWAHAALGRIRYADSLPGGPDSWLLYIKPTLTGDEPADVLEYHRNHPAFPHEPTIDQFFDESQWESYRKLGQHIAEQLFGDQPLSSQTTAKWRPDKMSDF